MAITSSDIDNQSFSVDRKGYSIEEVDVFLEKVSREVGALNSRVSELEKGIEEAKKVSIDSDKAKEMEQLIANQKNEIESLKEEVGRKVDDGKAISEALIVAQRSAEKIVQEANDKSAKIIKDANEKADYIEKDADSQKKRVLKEIDKLDKEKQETRKKYQTMLRDIISTMNKSLDASDTFDVTPSPSSTGKVSTKAGETSKNNPIKHASPATTTDVKPAPIKSEPQKDFSGFGDADFGSDNVD